jgi:hypothetical protein
VSVQVGWHSIEQVFTVRNSANPDNELEFTREEFIQFLKAVKNGELDEALNKKDTPAV